MASRLRLFFLVLKRPRPIHSSLCNLVAYDFNYCLWSNHCVRHQTPVKANITLLVFVGRVLFKIALAIFQSFSSYFEKWILQSMSLLSSNLCYDVFYFHRNTIVLFKVHYHLGTYFLIYYLGFWREQDKNTSLLSSILI